MIITTGDPCVTMVKAEEDGKVSQKRSTYFKHAVGKLLNKVCWLRPEIYNTVKYLSRHMSAVTENYVKAMHRVMGYVDGTP